MADQYQYVKMPDGSYGKFAADATPEQMRAAVEQHFPTAYAPAPLSGPIGPAPVDPITSNTEMINKAALNAQLHGVGKGALDFSQKLGHKLFGDDGNPDIDTTPQDSDERLGKVIGGALPGLALGAAAPEIAGSGVASALGRIGTNAAVGAASDPEHPLKGAAMGAGSGVLGEGLNAAAGPLLKKSLGIRDRDLGYGSDPVDFIRNHTDSWSVPGTVKQARSVVNEATADNAARTAGKTIDLNPAADTAIDQTLKVQGQVFQDPEAAAVQARTLDPFGKLADLSKVPAAEGLQIRTGLGKIGNYNPLRPDPQAVSLASKPVRSAVSEALKKLDPQIAENDDLIQNGLPVINRGRGAELKADPFERMIDAASRPTGGLASRLLAGHAIGPLGYIAPDLLTGPEALLKAGRLATKAPGAAKGLSGLLGSVDSQ